VRNVAPVTINHVARGHPAPEAGPRMYSG
jgi:hypothetical protein